MESIWGENSVRDRQQTYDGNKGVGRSELLSEKFSPYFDIEKKYYYLIKNIF